VDVHRPDILEQVAGCNGFMWRWAHFCGMGRIARRLLPVLERNLGMVVYPDQATCWHYDDKVAQAYLLPAAGVPVPRTWVWFDRAGALEWVRSATYPLVLKLAGGAGADNVLLVRDADEASVWIGRLFGRFVLSLDPRQFDPVRMRGRLRRAARIICHGVPETVSASGYDPQSGYVLFQQFLPDNTHDTRITVIGDRAFGFVRHNRIDDFRASGSGNIDWDPACVNPAFVRLAFDTARQLGTQSCAIDGLWDGARAVVGEVSYTYASWAVQACPGHWKLRGAPMTGDLEWVDGHMWPEEAQVEDFLVRLRRARG
jgi:hypothetical protein